MSCDRQIKALEDCVRKHPRDREVSNTQSLCRGKLSRINELLRYRSMRIFYVQIVCGRIEMQAAWCMIGLICPQEGESGSITCQTGDFIMQSFLASRNRIECEHGIWAVEDVECCAGHVKNGYIALKSIPKKCQDAMNRLDTCIEQHQAQQEPG